MSTRAVPPPTGLQQPGAALWRAMAKQWASDELTPDARERRMLEDACHEADVLAALSAELDAAMADGRLIVKGSQGQPVTHPHVAEARRSRAEIRATLLRLGFEDPSVVKAGAGPMSVAEAGRRGAMRKHYGNDYGLG